MDRIIQHYDFEEKDGFRYCYGNGVVYQADLTDVIDYDDGYFDEYTSREGTKIANALNEARVAMVDRYIGDGLALDIGIGSGEFIRSRNHGRGRITWGTDINEKAIQWLKREKLFARRNYDIFEGFCFWDTLEHVPLPETYLDRIPTGKYCFVSMPIYGDDLDRIPESKHFKPKEHLYYFSEAGLVEWMYFHGFDSLDVRTDEKMAGRNRVRSYTFRRERD